MLSHSHPSKLIILVILVTCGAQLAPANYLPTEAQAPVIIPFTFNPQVQENQRTSVLCTISSGDLPVHINWLKDGQPLTVASAQAKRITIKPDTDQSTLKFNSVRLEHAGNYTCVAKNRAGLQAHSTQLVVHGEPRWLSELRQEPIVATRGQTVVIDCQTTGWPRPTQTWMVKTHAQAEFEPLNTLTSARISLASNGSLIIRDADKADEANYLCRSTNGIGRGLSWSTSLKVTVPAHFESAKQQAQHVVRRQSQVQLRCDALGDEPITIEWFKNKQRLSNEVDPRYSIYNKPIANGLISQLVIRQTQRHDNSVYECLTRNQAGKDRLQLELVVQEEPDNIQGLQATQIGSRSVTLVWNEPYDGRSSIISYTFQYKRIQEVELDYAPDSSSDAVKPASTIPDDWQEAQRISLSVPPANATSGQERSVYIDKLEPSSKYVLRALAINAIGQSKFSQPMEFTTDEEEPRMGPTGIKAVAINSTSIQVSWDEVPKNKHFSIHGYYVGYRVASPNSAAPSNFIYKPYMMSDPLQPQQPISSASQQTSGPLNLSQARLETIIHDLRRDTSYEITVVAFNSRGNGPSSEFVVCKTNEMDAPKPVKLSIRRESNDTIHIEWQRDPTDQNPVDDYVLQQEKYSAAQERLERRLPASQTHYKAQGLKCGTRYTFKVTAQNKVGESQPSNTVSASTIGSLPAVPSKTNLIKMVNSTCLQVNLNSFQDGACRVRTFTVRYRFEKTTSPNGSPSSLVGGSAGSTANHQAFAAGSNLHSASHTKTMLGGSAGSTGSNNLAATGLAASEWITIGSKSNSKHMRLNEEDGVEYLCDLNPNGEYTIHVAASNDVGRSEAEYTVLMSSDELRRSFARDLLEFMATLPSFFAFVPSIMVFLLAGLLVSIVGLLLYASVIKYHQKFVIMHNQMRATRRAKQDEKRHRKLNSSRQSQKLDLWAEEYEEDGDADDDEDGDDDTGGSAVMDDGYDEDAGTDISGGSSARMHTTAARHPRRFAKLASSGHYVSNLGNMAFDTSSVDSRTQGKMSSASTCMSSSSPDSHMGRFRCLNSKQYVKMNEYSVLPPTSLSPAVANSIYGTTGPTATGPSAQASQQTLSSAALSAQNQHSLYYSTLRRTNMQTYLPNRRQHSQQLAPQQQQHSHQRRSQNLTHGDIYGYYMGPAAAGPTGAAPTLAGPLGSRSPADSRQSAQQAAEVAANSIFVPPQQQVIYSAPSLHGQPVFL